ncbi:MAG: DUF2520 domain-containing protein [Muribaculaceae bacterium]|nr:DUF2520 domain-containing protein [Muribaculaceae bacterium]
MRIAIVGSGNVATHISRGLASAGHDIAGVYSRTSAHARELADALGVPVFLSPEELAAAKPDVVLFSVADACVSELVGAFPPMPGVVALHTSGTLPQEVLSPITSDVGILYPLQTFSKAMPVELDKVPFFVEGTTDRTSACARELAESLSSSVHYANAAHRKVLHIAGVLSCNFPNYLWECCERLLTEAGYPLEVVEPLVRATVDKAFAIGPHKAQTGPARRGDREVIETHEKSLPAPLSEIYRLLSAEIFKTHHEQNSL